MAVRPGIELSERTVWELLNIIDSAGWTLCLPDKEVQKELRDKPYRHGVDGSRMVWYLHPRASTIRKVYLLALLQDTCRVPIHHLQSTRYYCAIFGGKDIEPTWDRAERLPPALCDDEWVIEATPKPKTRMQAKPKRRMQAIEDESQASSSESSSGHASSMSSQPTEPSKSSSSSSSSSSSRSSSPSNSPDSGRSEPHPAVAEDGHQQFQNIKGAVIFVLNKFTPCLKDGVQIAWQLRCHHPDHQQPL